jgi:hypothetical protein
MARGCPTNCGACAACLEADHAFERFTAHALGCYTCRIAGGEWADPADLCSVGRALFLQWGRAEGIGEAAAS